MYPNKYAKRVRKSYPLEINCALCGETIATYQKVGGPNLLRMYVERLTSCAQDLSEIPKVLACPTCGNVIANLYTTNDTKKEAYRMIPGSFHKHRL